MMRKKMKMWQLKMFYRLPIMSKNETLDYILKNKCSVARFGDGEFGIMLKSSNIGFQLISDELADLLKDVLSSGSKNQKLLICMPGNMNDISGCSDASKKYWEGWKIEKQQKVVDFIRGYVPKRYCFGDAQMTRPYMGYNNKAQAGEIFEKIKRIWSGRDVLIAEGEKSRLGVGNDLFDGAKSVERILTPAKNAFDVYEKILESILRRHKDGQVVLIALGPTATVLAADLSKRGIWAIDIGHLDIEYEWFLKKAKKKVPIKGKYVNEVSGGDEVANCRDKKYIAEIVENIKM